MTGAIAPVWAAPPLQEAPLHTFGFHDADSALSRVRFPFYCDTSRDRKSGDRGTDRVRPLSLQSMEDHIRLICLCRRGSLLRCGNEKAVDLSRRLGHVVHESHWSELNRRPLDYESSALPLSYSGGRAGNHKCRARGTQPGARH